MKSVNDKEAVRNEISYWQNDLKVKLQEIVGKELNTKQVVDIFNSVINNNKTIYLLMKNLNNDTN